MPKQALYSKVFGPKSFAIGGPSSLRVLVDSLLTKSRSAVGFKTWHTGPKTGWPFKASEKY